MASATSRPGRAGESSASPPPGSPSWAAWGTSATARRAAIGGRASARSSPSGTPATSRGFHLTPPLAPPDEATFSDLTERERAALASLEHSAEWDSGYSREHATRPQTIGYAL